MTKPAQTERRVFSADGLRIEARADGRRRLRGHAAVFGQLSGDLGGFREQVAPGAFAEAIKGDDVRALFNHDPNFVLGRTSANTLRLAEDARGLSIEIDLPDNQTVRDLVAAPIERGDISQMSFGFSVRPNGQDWAKDDQGQVVRTLKRVRLFDVSPVTFPAYPQTDVAVRELRAWQDAVTRDVPLIAGHAIETLPDFEKFLRDAGFPKAAARKIAAGGWHALAAPDDLDPAAADKLAIDFASRIDGALRSAKTARKAFHLNQIEQRRRR